MKLIEGGGTLKLPLYLADNISDMKHSRNEVLSAIDPKFRSNLQKIQSFEDITVSNTDLPDNFPSYYSAIQVLISRVNHDPIKDSDFLGITLFDSNNFIFASLPSKFSQWVRQLREPTLSFDYNFWKNTLWIQRQVILSVTYCHNPDVVFDRHEDQYELTYVYNFTRGEKVQGSVEKKLSNFQNGLAGI